MATVDIACQGCGRTITVELARPGGFTAGKCPECGRSYTVDVDDDDDDA